MREYKLTDWLPTTKKEVELRGWDTLDVILFSADAYVDHPSFGTAVIGRILEAEGLRVAIVTQPNAISRNWDVPACSLEWHPDVWIPWSTSILQTAVSVQKMLIRPTDGMTYVRNTRPSFTHRR